MVYTTLIPVIVGSGDQNAYPSSTVSDFTVELADALLLQGRWQCRCDSVSFPNPNYKSVTTPTSNSVIVTMPGVLDGAGHDASSDSYRRAMHPGGSLSGRRT